MIQPAFVAPRAESMRVKYPDGPRDAEALIVLPDGKLLRGPEVKIAPLPGQSPNDPKLVDNGWVDLRSSNWRKWTQRAAAMLKEIDPQAHPDQGSRRDMDLGSRRHRLRPGRMAAWIFRTEDRGERMKR